MKVNKQQLKNIFLKIWFVFTSIFLTPFFIITLLSYRYKNKKYIVPWELTIALLSISCGLICYLTIGILYVIYRLLS